MKVVEGIEFSFYSPEQLRKMSAVKINVPDTYDEDGYPISNGLADQHLGVIDPGLRCKTCGGRMKTCSGHFGHIELVRPVLHVGYAKTLYQLLKATCRRCGRLLLDIDSLDKAKKVAECPHCDEKQKVVKFVRPTSFFEEERKLLPSEIRERLERIPDEDLRMLKVAVRPEWFILTVLPVPPVAVRPSITLETGERSEDDLTHKLVDIIRINQRLAENIDAGAPQLIIEDLWELLQYHVVTYFDNETTGIPPARHRSGRQLRTLFQRLKGKEGRFRYNLSGKRVNFSARTVISPDPTLGINELGVPESIAKELTLPLTVNEWNVEQVKNLITANTEKINYVIRPDGKRKKVTAANMEEVLGEIAVGFTIERQLMDGDTVIFNRQPSLHRVSMMCHTVKVLPGKTFRFNVADCRPYNADFDGDEMNVHVPQNEEAQAEAEILMKVQEQILSPRNGEPIISPDLDQISGLYLLTLPGVAFPRAEACELLNAAGVCKDVAGGVTGRELFGMLLPEKFDFTFKNKVCKNRSVACGDCDWFAKDRCSHDALVQIRKGKLATGHIDSRTSDALTKEVFTKFGADESRKFLDAVTKLSNHVVTKYGLSLSLADYNLDPEAEKELREINREARMGVKKLTDALVQKRLVRAAGKSLKDTFEEQVMGILESARDKCGKIVLKHIKRQHVNFGGTVLSQNPAILMSKAGAKGKLLNVVQMAAMVGQQAIRGKRMTAGYYGRLLPHFKRGDYGGYSRGFITANYKEGLDPLHYYFHAAGGRDSVVDKGVNPAKTGYMQRRLINALQDLTVHEDISVRDAEGTVIQFYYGGDGMDSSGHPVAYGEPVGVVAAQSIGEPGTQMSLPYEEKVLINYGAGLKAEKIGEAVDSLFGKYGFVREGETEICDLPPCAVIEVPSLTQQGKIEWKRLKAASRHRYGKKLLKITTRSGRSITATDNHSFVLRKNNSIVPVAGRALEKGDRIPVLRQLPLEKPSSEFELEELFPKELYWHGSELRKAIETGGSGTGFTVPVGAEQLHNRLNHESVFDVEDGFVYPVQHHGNVRMPEKMPLDSSAGWFVGAYLSEGSAAKNSVSISNTDETFLRRTREFAERLNAGYSEKDNFRGFARGHDLCIHSSLLSEFLVKSCGKGSYQKRVPQFAFSAPTEFVGGLLRAYFEGDGNVSVERSVIRASSMSQELLQGIALLLSRLGIFGRIRREKIGSSLVISHRYAAEFRQKIGFDSVKKKNSLDRLCNLPSGRTSYDAVEMVPSFGSLLKDVALKTGVPPRLVNNFTKKQLVGITALKKYIELFSRKAAEKGCNIDKELAQLKAMAQEDVVWDEIASLEYVDAPDKPVYDFSVDGLETFTTFSGIVTHNTLRTFHYAGVASLAQLGFTRLVEIVDARKAPKSPVMDVQLLPQYAKDLKKVTAIANGIEQITLRKVATIKEDFESKRIRILLDKAKLKELKLDDEEVFAAIRAVNDFERRGEAIFVKPAQDSLKSIRKTTSKLMEVVLKGIPGINRAIILEKDGIYSIATEGSNLEAVLKMPEVDSHRTTTNDTMEVKRVLGVEAARNSIIAEIQKVLTAQDLKVDYRHTSLIADMMTSRGEVKSIGRHGLAGEKASVFARAAFEETTKHLVNASVEGQKDMLRGIAENIIIGQTIPAGTGKVRVVM
ncbi:MAG: DNA-directed RNA polymerase subunit A', partial [Candidatus Micrarchaeota archaeon]